MLVCLSDLLVALFDVLYGVLSIVFGGLNDRILLLHHCRQVLVEGGKLKQRLLNALQLIVASANVAQYRARMSCAIGSEL